MSRYIYGVDPITGHRRLLDEVPDGYDQEITDEDIRSIWSRYSNIEIKHEKEIENETINE